MLINKSKSADTRSALHLIQKDELLESSVKHISDVKQGMMWIVSRLISAANMHDFTKVMNIDEFYDQFSKAQRTGKWGKGWYDKIHIVRERHHLKNRVPKDVDMIDVLEMMVDCVMAGMARSGKYRNEEPDAKLLVRAYKNTVKKLCADVHVMGGK